MASVPMASDPDPMASDPQHAPMRLVSTPERNYAPKSVANSPFSVSSTWYVRVCV